MRSCHRAPRTTQERRANGKRDYIVVDGYKIRTRARRNIPNLVEAWDDVTVRYDWRCWKRYRKTQYKGTQ